MLGEEIKVLPLLRKTPTFPRKICICTFSVKLRQQRGGSEFFLSVWEFQSLTYISHLSLLFKGCSVKDISLFVIATNHHTPERRNDSHRCDQPLCWGSGNTQNLTPSAFFSHQVHWLHQIRKIKVKHTSIVFAAPLLTRIHLHNFVMKLLTEKQCVDRDTQTCSHIVSEIQGVITVIARR